MRRTHLSIVPVAALAFLGLAAATTLAVAGEPLDLAVRRARVQAPERVAKHTAKVTTAFHVDDALRSFDFATETARFVLGPVDLLDKPAGAEGVHVSRKRPWSVTFRSREGDRRVKAKLNLATGVFRIRTRGVDLFPLVRSSSVDVLVRLELGERAFERRIDFRMGRKAWTHRGARFPDLPPAPPPLFTTLFSGSASPIQTAQTQVFLTTAEFEQFWAQIPGAGARPAMDFTNEVVVGVFLGARDDALYSVAVTGAALQGTNLLVTHQETRPGPTCPASLLTTIPYPFTLVRVPRVRGSVLFQSLPTATLNCF